MRPGPIQGGMVHPYLRRRSGEEPVDYPSDEVRQALERTLGVPIFQEQVMQLAILAADFTPGEADQLRRAMAAWKRKGGLGPFHARLVGRMVAKGYEPEYAERIFKQIEGFGEYGFPESHAASFALLVYVSAWLKCHHPDAFLAALLNSQPMGFYAPAQLVRDAREHGVQVLPVDVRHSVWDSGAGRRRGHRRCGAHGSGPLLRRCAWASAASAASQQDAAAQRLVAARAEGAFANAEDLARRAQLDAHQLELLAQADALRAAGRPPPPGRLGRGRCGHPRHAAAARNTHPRGTRPTLARARCRHHRAGRLPRHRPEPGTQHPVGAAAAAAGGLQGAAGGRAEEVPARPAGARQRHRHPPPAPGNRQGRGLRDAGRRDRRRQRHRLARRWWKQRRPLLAGTLLTVYGIWQREGEVRHLVAMRLVDHTMLLQGLASKSRNFR